MAYGRNLLLLSIIFLVCSFALNLVGPVWPVYIKNYLSASMTELGFVFSLSNAVSAVMQVTCGFLSDKYGRKRLHALGTLLAAFPPLMYALANNWLDLIPWVMLSGFATGLYLPMRWAIVADVSSSKTMAKAYGWVNISWLGGSTIAPYIGGMIADSFGIRFPFYFYSLLIFAAFPLTLLMEETRRKPQAITAEKESEAHLIQGYLGALIMFSLINIIQGIGIGVTGPVISVFVLSQFPVDYTFIGILFAIGFGAASMIVQMPASKLSDAFDRRRIIFIAIVASAPFFLLFAYSQNAIELISLMFLSNAILNTSWPAFQTLMMDTTPSSKWGLVNGVSATTWWIGMMTGNALSGILWDNWGMYAPFWTSAIAVGLSATPLLLLKETRIKKNREDIRK
jgi:DHA1 family multidrug resistance protein-like MFS transporter